MAIGSLHFHFIFSTRHLSKCPWDADAATRGGEHQSMPFRLDGNAHEIYWDRVSEVFSETLGGNLRPDTQMRSVTQWRRTPWAIRTSKRIRTSSICLSEAEFPRSSFMRISVHGLPRLRSTFAYRQTSPSPIPFGGRRNQRQFLGTLVRRQCNA